MKTFTLVKKSVSQLEDLEIYLLENYSEGEDFTTTTSRGDDCINSVTILNGELLNDSELTSLLN